MVETEIPPGYIGNSISRRSELATELTQKLREQDGRDEEMKKKLLEKAPPEIRQWLEEEGIIGHLFKYGQSTRKIVFGDSPFGNLKDILDKMAELQKAWEEVVRIVPDNEPESCRVQIRFSALM